MLKRPLLRGNRETISNLSFYNDYKKKYLDSTISYDLYKDIINSCFEEISNIILTDLIGFKLPRELGFLVIDKYKTNKKKINFGIFKKTGKIVLYINLHSDGYSYRVKWIKRSSYKFITFVLYRFLSRAITLKVFEGYSYRSVKSSDYINYKKLKSKFK